MSILLHYTPPALAILNGELPTLLNKVNTIFVGDLNCKHMKWGFNSTNKNGKTLKENLYDSSLENINLPLNYLKIKKNISKYDRIQQVLTSKARKLYHKINYNNVKEILNKIDVAKCLTVTEIEQKTKKLQECLKEIDEAIPRKEIQNDLGLPPEALNRIKIRRKLLFSIKETIQMNK